MISKSWTLEEDNLIKKLYDTMSYTEMTKHLNRSVCSLRHRGQRIGNLLKTISI